MYRHGMYEVTYKALNYPPPNWDNVKEQTIIVEADDLEDAERVAKKKLKDNGDDFIHIGLYAVKFLKYTNETKENATEKDTYSKSSSTPSKSHKGGSIIIGGIVFILFLVALFTGVFTNNSTKVDGRYYLVSITGTQSVTATSLGNYLDLDDGVCTLHISLSNPQGSSTHTYYYTGDKANNIKFKDNFIYMDDNNRVIVTLKYDNGQYNKFIYEKK